MDNSVGMFDWEDEAFEDRCLDLQGKVRTVNREGGLVSARPAYSRTILRALEL